MLSVLRLGASPVLDTTGHFKRGALFNAPNSAVMWCSYARFTDTDIEAESLSTLLKRAELSHRPAPNQCSRGPEPALTQCKQQDRKSPGCVSGGALRTRVQIHSLTCYLL